LRITAIKVVITISSNADRNARKYFTEHENDRSNPRWNMADSAISKPEYEESGQKWRARQGSNLRPPA
jgi:hypothetical protein